MSTVVNLGYKRATIDTLRELAFGSITGSFVNVGSATTQAASWACIINTTDKDLYFSWNGSTNHMRLAPTSYRIVDLQACGLKGPIGIQFAVKHTGSAPTQGAAAVEIIYALS
jgi:hypothetical protein